MKESIRRHLNFLYGESSAADLADAINVMLARQAGRFPGSGKGLSEKDCMLITYADQVQTSGESPLATLEKFLHAHCGNFLTAVHLLPFYPSSSDDGFSVMNYFAVDPAFGEWEDIEALGRRFDLMFDAVFNHASAQGEWFQKFLRQEAGWETAFYTVEGEPDLSQVVRPRALPLLTTFETAGGCKRVWTTFSADQADINFSDPRMLLRILEALLFYVEKGARYIRLDAIAFLWKIPGTPCIHLEQTHRVIQLFRAVLNEAAPGTQLITETNVPHRDNISYFGDGANEAQLAYNFALPPLIFHTLRTGDATRLRGWAQTLAPPSPSVTFFNFLASHDGIGLNPARGILEPAEIDTLVQTTLDHGGFVSCKNNPDGTRSPYELNISYFDALSNPNGSESEALQISRFLAAHAIMFALRGLPGIYFHSLFGSRGDRAGAEQSGIPRRINRKKLMLSEITSELEAHKTIRGRVFSGMVKLLTARAAHPAFDPHASQAVLESANHFFAIERTAKDGSRARCIVNVSPESQPNEIDVAGWHPLHASSGRTDVLPPYGICWVASD